MESQSIADQIVVDEDGVKRLTVPLLRKAYRQTGVEPVKAKMIVTGENGQPCAACGLGVMVLATLGNIDNAEHEDSGMSSRYCRGFWRGYDGHGLPDEYKDNHEIVKGYEDGREANKAFFAS
jgi:hypothetical protein